MMSISSTSSQTLLSTPQLTISVIVPERNGGAKLRKSLSALTKTIPPPVELIVVAEGDTDESWRIAEEFMGKVLRIPEPQGHLSHTQPTRERSFWMDRASLYRRMSREMDWFKFKARVTFGCRT